MDTPVFIYHLEDIAPYTELTIHLLACAGAGGKRVIVSAISVAEILAGPWKAGDRWQATRLEQALRALPGMVVAEVRWEAANR